MYSNVIPIFILRQGLNRTLFHLHKVPTKSSWHGACVQTDVVTTCPQCDGLISVQFRQFRQTASIRAGLRLSQFLRLRGASKRLMHFGVIRHILYVNSCKAPPAVSTQDHVQTAPPPFPSQFTEHLDCVFLKYLPQQIQHSTQYNTNTADQY